MSMNGMNTVFEIEKEIRSVMADGHLIVDAGMFVGQDGETWRDCCIEVAADEREYCFTYSSLGNYDGDMPPKMALNIITILSKYEQAGVA